MAKRKRTRGVRGTGTITQLPGGQWRLRVTMGGRQVDYGFYATEELAGDAQARWRLTHLLPEDDPLQAVELPASVAVGGIRCDEWFERWQEAKKARRSRVRINNKRKLRAFQPTARLVLCSLTGPGHRGGAWIRCLGPRVRPQGQARSLGWTAS
jgi:hypothetical protein